MDKEQEKNEDKVKAKEALTDIYSEGVTGDVADWFRTYTEKLSNDTLAGILQEVDSELTE